MQKHISKNKRLQALRKHMVPQHLGEQGLIDTCESTPDRYKLHAFFLSLLTVLASVLFVLVRSQLAVFTVLQEFSVPFVLFTAENW